MGWCCGTPPAWTSFGSSPSTASHSRSATTARGLFATDSDDFASELHVFDAVEGTPITSMETPEEGVLPLGGTFLPDGRHVAADQTATTWLYDTDTGEVGATVCADEMGINVVASPDGELLALDGRSGIEVFDLERVFDLGASTPETCADAGTNPSDAARFSAGGRERAKRGVQPDDAADAVRVYTLDVDELLEIADAKVTRELTPEERSATTSQLRAAPRPAERLTRCRPVRRLVPSWSVGCQVLGERIRCSGRL